MRTPISDSAKPSGLRGLTAFDGLLQGRVFRYGLAPLAVAIAFLIRLALAPVLGDASFYLLFVPAVLVAAGLGGLGPGLLATGLSVVVGSLVLPEIAGAVLF